MNNTERWHSWVLNIAAEADPPDEWKTILRSLSQIGLSGTYIDKIELAAFAIRGRRTARWKVPTNHPEYATLENSLGAAKKLTWLLLRSEGAPGITTELYNSLKCAQTPSCVLLEGHNGPCTTIEQAQETTRCPICLDNIKLEDFKRNGRADPYSIQMGHLAPLSRTAQGHNAKNVVWAHRRCNYIQDEQTVEETIKTLREIVEKHGYNR
jgi:hypothetical protein